MSVVTLPATAAFAAPHWLKLLRLRADKVESDENTLGNALRADCDG